MVQEKGTISIHTENIFPIIKKFLYSDNEIFLRELVSNAVDATQKIKRLSSIGQYNGELGDLTIQVSFDETAKTITISDKGLGMTADEIKKYINQIAFSGATEFMEKFKEAQDANEIIGRFGLGFYSAFMVADKVEIRTLSYLEGAEPAQWICDGVRRRPYRELNVRQKISKLTLPIQQSGVYKALARLPKRAVRRAIWTMSGKPTTSMKFGKLRAEYEHFWESDCDACSSIDVHETTLFFESRGYEIFNPPASALRRITAGHVPVIVRKHNRSSGK